MGAVHAATLDLRRHRRVRHPDRGEPGHAAGLARPQRRHARQRPPRLRVHDADHRRPARSRGLLHRGGPPPRPRRAGAVPARRAPGRRAGRPAGAGVGRRAAGQGRAQLRHELHPHDPAGAVRRARPRRRRRRRPHRRPPDRHAVPRHGDGHRSSPTGDAPPVRRAPGAGSSPPTARPATVTGPAAGTVVRLERWRLFEGAGRAARGVRGVERPLGGPGGDGGRPTSASRPAPTSATTRFEWRIRPSERPRPLRLAVVPPFVIAVDDPAPPTCRPSSNGTSTFAHEHTPPEDVHALDLDAASSIRPSPSSAPAATASCSPSAR